MSKATSQPMDGHYQILQDIDPQKRLPPHKLKELLLKQRHLFYGRFKQKAVVRTNEPSPQELIKKELERMREARQARMEAAALAAQQVVFSETAPLPAVLNNSLLDSTVGQIPIAEKITDVRLPAVEPLEHHKEPWEKEADELVNWSATLQ
jgi:hypothetical protein